MLYRNFNLQSIGEQEIEDIIQDYQTYFSSGNVMHEGVSKTMKISGFS